MGRFPRNLVKLGKVIALLQSLTTAECRARFISVLRGLLSSSKKIKCLTMYPHADSSTFVIPWGLALLGWEGWFQSQLSRSSVLPPFGQVNELPASVSLLVPMGLTQRGGHNLRRKCMLFCYTIFLLFFFNIFIGV